MTEPSSQSNRESLSRGGVFVGRQQEMAVLERALNDALSGRGRLVMLAGEPGIGKTRVCQELAARADTLGARGYWGRCYEEEGAPPYWPWIQPIRTCLQDLSPEELHRRSMTQGAENRTPGQ